MKRWYAIIVLWVWLLPASVSVAQDRADSARLMRSLRYKTLAVADTMWLDSLSVMPGSLIIAGQTPDRYVFSPQTARLIWLLRPDRDSVHVRYRVLAIDWNRRYAHKTYDIVDSNVAFPFFSLSDEQEASGAGFVNFNSIDYQGAYGRSLMVGNQQDLSLNSNFNLQLNGYILDSVRIEAALTDNNIPFQPEGNTQQIQEFDKIFITFEKGGHRLTAGDYALTRPESYFLNFDKRVQGLYYQGDLRLAETVRNKIGVSASVAKGQFARNQFTGQEGNQGPYKLTGNNGEQFFIVLAGSEKVYLDGVLLERGDDRDYTIDYNTAEITFMPRRMITKDRRIQVEFEYQNRNYLNTLFYFSDELNVGKKWTFRMHAYANQDAKNQPYLQTLSGEQKRFLSTIGDDISEAFYRQMREDTFAADKILYRMVDTLVNGVVYDSVFVYVGQPDTVSVYNLGFSYVGEHKGNYVISGMQTNGRSYAWVPPEQGVPQGAYAPVVLLVTPKKHQVFTLETSYQIDSFKHLSVELAASNYAPNLFSQIDKDQHWGFAGKTRYEARRMFGKDRDSAGQQLWSLSNLVLVEHTQATFRPVAPYRPVEFSRDWNIEMDSVPAAETMLALQTALEKKDQLAVRYRYSHFERSIGYTGNRHLTTLEYRHGGFRAGGTLDWMTSVNEFRNTSFWRPEAFVAQAFGREDKWQLGASWIQERNALHAIHGDTLMAASFANDRYAVYFKSREDDKNPFSIRYEYRRDLAPSQQEFDLLSSGHAIEGNMKITEWEGQTLLVTGAYRRLAVADSLSAAMPRDDQNLLGRLTYTGSLMKGFVIPNLLYELGSGQQQKREYVYVQVPAGQGIYMWNDYNQDGVQQANEFEIGQYPDQKQYIRIITPTNEYVGVNYVQLQYAMQLTPERLWDDASSGWRRFVSRFTDRFSMQINRRALSSAGFATFNPFYGRLSSDEIIADQTTINNLLYFNQTSAVWGLSHHLSYSSSKNLLTYGLESAARRENTVQFRRVFWRYFTARLSLEEQYRSYVSAVPDDGRTYHINGYCIHPELIWISPGLLRITGGYRWEQRQNRAVSGGERALIQSVDLNARLSFPKAGAIQASGTYARIGYTGVANTPLAFTMLDALERGTNWLWHFNWDRRVGKSIEISLQYEGRKPAGKPVVHTGTMSIRALL